MKRREFIRNSGVLLAAVAAPFSSSIVLAAEESALIYLSPIKTNGALSSCQAEVWFVQDAADMVIVTAPTTWRAQAVAKGLKKTQVWVGDVGAWQSSDGRYKDLPSLMANAAHITDSAEHARVLEKFGAKYVSEWGTWGPRFAAGLADESRVMLRYRPV
jgi:hypothetical protein